jgi:glutathione S-transferase
MLQFKLLEPRAAFVDYATRVTDRPAYRRAKEIDDRLAAELQGSQQQQRTQQPA